ncbi:hypothetical protein PGT21_030015 [Puccinia graminis f. sp. tritici]|uniref:Uncharacterized protein n=1 Tax=Puccinia graminis f. sp. tritici TaxID=56615 RepID=A0A5B0PEU0_PUCGR|nr:hypothetical protein PGT21_030015 [Puccinia graminis f. sp. tritici]KAA1120701.1 hypothetical protein PGTUg99_024062 [Puccinia graminis f. sp. tritici]
MLISLKSIMVVSLAALNVTAATLEEEQKKRCTFSCATYTGRAEGGCAKVMERSGDEPVKWEMVMAHPTENHKDFYNCLGTEMAFSICCVPGSIKIPSKGKPMILESGGDPNKYRNMCSDTDPEQMDVDHFPSDCKPPN